jgi:hypothetical protein
MKIYECGFCDGLHVTTGRSDKDYFKLQRSLENLRRKMADPGYIARAPKEIQARHAQIVLELQSRLSELETRYKIRKTTDR